MTDANRAPDTVLFANDVGLPHPELPRMTEHGPRPAAACGPAAECCG